VKRSCAFFRGSLSCCFRLSVEILEPVHLAFCGD
jgi:hypothetical protein